MIQAIVAAVITFFASAPFWGLASALVGRLRFDGISVDFVESTSGAIGLYSDAGPRWGIRLKVTNVHSAPIAIEKIHAEMQLKPPHGTSNVQLARGQCSVSIVRDGPYGTDESMESYPIVVDRGGGQVLLQLMAYMQYYSKERRYLVLPHWERMDSLGIEDPEAPIDSEGNRMYHHIVDITSLQLRVQINGKIRKLPVEVFKLK